MDGLLHERDNGRRNLKLMARGPDKRAGKYLNFRLGKEDFAIKVLSVCEIMGMQELSTLPEAPAYVKGVINLRGKAIPVIDLRLKLGMESVKYTQRTCIIVAQIETITGHRLVGTIVDGVFEVLTLGPGDISDPPESGSGAATPYVVGVTKIKGRVKVLLDINLVLTPQELHGLEGVLP